MAPSVRGCAGVPSGASSASSSLSSPITTKAVAFDSTSAHPGSALTSTCMTVTHCRLRHLWDQNCCECASKKAWTQVFAGPAITADASEDINQSFLTAHQR